MDSSSSSNVPAAAMEEGDAPRVCRCNLPALLITEGTLAHPLRRFYVCANYFTPEIKCMYWVWKDPELNDHYKDNIRTMKKQEKYLSKRIVECTEHFRSIIVFMEEQSDVRDKEIRRLEREVAKLEAEKKQK